MTSVFESTMPPLESTEKKRNSYSSSSSSSSTTTTTTTTPTIKDNKFKNIIGIYKLY